MKPPCAILALACLIVPFALTACASPKPPVLHPAREAALIGGTRLVPADGATPGHVTGFVQPGDGADFTVRAPADGFYFLDLDYACGSAKHIPVLVNGNAQGSRRFPETTGFETRRFGRVRLSAGDNTIRIGTDWGYADIAAIRISPASKPGAFRLRAAPVNPDASPEARALYTRLIAEFGRRTFAGQHEADVRQPTRLDQVARLTDGAAPAILGLDFQLYSQVWTNPEPTGATELALDWSLNRHGIVTISWHWLSPFGGADPVWSSFSTDKTTFDVSRIADESSAEYAAILRDLDLIAAQLARLRDARVPVLWRPLHEAEGGWFWWGARGPEAAKTLYRLMFDRFTRHHRLDNLIWVWTTTDNDDAPDWYPGDNQVDILAADLYFPAGVHGDFFTLFDQLRERYQGRKPIALGECGVMPALDKHAHWLWFLTWDDFILRPEINPPDFVRQIYRSPRAVVLPPARPSTHR